MKSYTKKFSPPPFPRLERISVSSGMQRKIFSALGCTPGQSDNWLDNLPFTGNDVTAGTEIELQAAVIGNHDQVDLPLTIENSNYFANIARRTTTGDLPASKIHELEHWLRYNQNGVWENSWVRIPRGALGLYACQVLNNDLRKDKSIPDSGMRTDADRFTVVNRGRGFLRVPVSYLLKLALADAVGSQPEMPDAVRRIGERLMRHLVNDNSSPESSSFNVSAWQPNQGLGRAIARETAKRYILTQVLIQYANLKFMLRETGQYAQVYFSPHPPLRQKALNNCVSDAFYRELFMSPCLSGWSQGQEKQRYMHLCHQVLSRSHLNGLAKLREAGIITRRLVLFPGTSNVSLANNGVHISLGSRRLTRNLKNADTGFSPAHEKHLGDLTSKIIEHFLPLFVGTFSAAPYRLDFSDFHPEQALGFMPHQLDYTHLRMLWRRWRKKADLNPLSIGVSMTPFGPIWMDRMIGSLLRLRGDYVPDFRLIDYPVALLSTENSPAFDGRMGNQQKLKKDLSELGIFDEYMSFYCLYRLREFSNMGFSGFEGRHYSLFANLSDDLAAATDLQHLITALAFKYMAQGKLTHAHIPDSPELESERRQIFFGAAIGIPSFFVRQNTANLFLRQIIAQTGHLRSSRRYAGYWRIDALEYRRRLLELLRKDGADLIEMLGAESVIATLEERINTPARAGVAGRLTSDILQELGASSPLAVSARQFNAAAENFYRTTLRKKHMCQAMELLEQDIINLDNTGMAGGPSEQAILRNTLDGVSARKFFAEIKQRIPEEKAELTELRKFINLILVSCERDRRQTDAMRGEGEINADNRSSIH